MTTTPKSPLDARRDVIIRAIEYFGVWPENLTSRIMFFEGERITKDEFNTALYALTELAKAPKDIKEIYPNGGRYTPENTKAPKDAREFWLATGDEHNLAIIRKAGEKWSTDVNGMPDDKWLHVVEMSALTAAQAEIERLRKHQSVRRCGKCGNIGMHSMGIEMLDEIEKLKRENARLGEALERITRVTGMTGRGDAIMLAEEALEGK
jgi:hypothetical protein